MPLVCVLINSHPTHVDHRNYGSHLKENGKEGRVYVEFVAVRLAQFAC